MPNVARSVVETNLFSPFGQSLPTVAHIRTYQAMLARAEQVVADRNFQFALIHLPVPHAPHTYNRQTGEFSRKNSPVSAYVDSLALVDRTLGELRKRMEGAGVWDSTTVLVSSDHSYRVSEVLDGKWDSRIPFLLKLAGRSEGQTLDQEFNTIISGELLLAILKGEVQTAQEAANWIKDHSGLKS
jgi:arylsulfatase A-like enzyme